MFWDAAGTRHEKIAGLAEISGYFNQVRREGGGESVIALDNATRCTERFLP